MCVYNAEKIMMPQRIRVFLVAILILFIFLGGCGDGVETPKPKDEASARKELAKLNIAYSSRGLMMAIS